MLERPILSYVFGTYLTKGSNVFKIPCLSPLYFCLCQRRPCVSMSHKEVGISMCHPASSFLLQSVSCIHFFFSLLLKVSLYNYVTDHFCPLQSNNSFQCQKLSLMLCASKPNYDFSSCISLYPYSSSIRYVQSLIYSTHTAWPHNVRYHDMYQVFKYSGQATYNRYAP